MDHPFLARPSIDGLGLGPIDHYETHSSLPAPSPSFRLFAIIIGINEYAFPVVCPSLKGAVRDALAIKAYLEGHLGVPQSQIRLLLDAAATKSAIIQEFDNLVADQRIQRDDPILIFYAGHGGEVSPRPKWHWEAGDTKTQMLIPHDFGTEINGRVVYGILDRTIGTLLSRVAEKCGDNITVIFDCCHSGSGTRTVSQSGRIARVIEIPHDISWDIKPEICSDAQSAVTNAPSFLYRGMTSHVLLAACRAKELAYEVQGKGVFTTALLKLLHEVGPQNLTYDSLLRRLPRLTEQNPQCEGHHRHRALFNAKAESRGRVLFKVEKHGDSYVMYAGTARGIAIGDEFTIHDDPEPSTTSPPLGLFIVREAHPFRSTMVPLSNTSGFELQNPAFALLTKAGNMHDLRVYVPEHTELSPVFQSVAQKMHHVRPDRPRILLVEKEKAALIIDLDRDLNQVVLDMRILDENAVPPSRNWQRIPFSVELEESKLHRILDLAARFHWHLCRTSDHVIQDKVRFEFTEVGQDGGELDEDLNPVMKPIGNDLIENGSITLVSKPDVRRYYGVRIANDTTATLYGALFYFNMNDLSITLINPLPAAAEYEVDPLLPPRGAITLGYGRGGGDPIIFDIPQGQDIELGIFKLFLFTEYVDLSDVGQDSPFKRSRGIDRAKPPTSRSIWDTIMVPVVQRR